MPVPAVVLAQVGLWCKLRVNRRDQVVKASTVTEMFVKIYLVLVQSSRKEDVINSSGNFWVTCGYFAQNRDLTLSACGFPFRSLFSVAD